ncbi:MAG: sulfite oxidase heme-binding subunit YedZ [Pyrinomonadaceae bacterium]
MNDVRFNKILISINAFIPFVMIAYDGFNSRLGANPLEFFLRTTGVLTLTSLVITLSITPLRKLFGWNSLIKYRRMIGLYAFFYACLHLITYSIFDKSLNVPEIVADVLKRPFIAIGMIAFLMLVPLAVTSTNGMVKRLGGKNWSRLHKLTYVIVVLGVIHFWMIVKSDIFYPAMFGGVVLLLLLFRLVYNLRSKAQPVKKTVPA